MASGYTLNVPFELTLPFSAIVGQEQMKRALMLNAVDPGIGGVLIRGDRGTAKSSAVRALARLLPDYEAVEGCPYRCDPATPSQYCDDCRRRTKSGSLAVTRLPMRIVELPINASEDRLVGSIDIEAAVKAGTRRFQPGVLAEANRNLLYVDEVNLLDDHLVDVLLDAAAMGVNVVEREGISIVHPSHFILVGTMNPEEGELRPQLLDRFGLCVDVVTPTDIDQRPRIMALERSFLEDPRAVHPAWAAPAPAATRTRAGRRRNRANRPALRPSTWGRPPSFNCRPSRSRSSTCRASGTRAAPRASGPRPKARRNAGATYAARRRKR